MSYLSKNAILKTITATMVVVGILSACAIESDSIIPVIGCMVSSFWLGLFGLANR